jgi:endo-beta-N-acetylglucosaminidase D
MRNRSIVKALAQTSSISIAPRFPGSNSQDTGLAFGSSSQIQTLLAYDPANDPDAKYFRSLVPLAQHIPAFAAAQAHSNLDPRPLVTNLSMYYEGVVVNDANAGQYQYSRYSNSNNVFVPRIHQYEDVVGGWQGAQGLPTTAYTDTCHRTGALSVGIIYQPYFSSDANSFVYQAGDGSFPVGNKLVDLAAYFGFDGYFLNVEESLTQEQAQALMTMLNAMKAQAKKQGLSTFYLQWYDAVTTSGSVSYQNELNGNNSGWLTDGGCDSIFLNYWWGQSQVSETTATAQNLNLDAFKDVFFGLELEGRTQIGISSSPEGGESANDIPLVIPPDGKSAPNGGIGLFDPSKQTVAFAQKAAGSSAPLTTLLNTAHAFDRQFWCGSAGNPGADYTPTTQNPSGGVSDYITERSVIGFFPFVSRFNVGTGDQFFIDGAVSSANPWFSMGIQDILPIWQWWTKDFNSDDIPSGLLSADYDLTTAWNGGSSLMVSGQLGPNNPTELRLFKTELTIGSASDYSLNLTYLLGQSGSSNLYIGLIFQDAPSTVVWVQAPDGTARGSSDWLQTSISLANYAGKTLAALSLGFKVNSTVNASTYTIYIGEIAVLSSSPINVAAPTGFTLENSQISNDGSSAQLRLAWNYDPSVWYYDIYRQPTGGGTQNMIWLGRISCDCYYVNAMPKIDNEDSAALQLVAVSIDGTETISSSATLVFQWTDSGNN